LAIGREADVALCHAALDGDCAVDGVHRADKLDQKTGAHQLDDPPIVRGNGRIDQLQPMFAKAFVGALLIPAHEAAEPDDVARHDCRQTPLPAWSGYRSIVRHGRVGRFRRAGSDR
jgi:hypothetical protein